MGKIETVVKVPGNFHVALHGITKEVWASVMRSKGETYGRIGLLRSYGNLQSYWTTTKLRKLTVVFDYYEAMETYSRI